MSSDEYLDGQAARNFNPGEAVKVLRKCGSNERGWDNTWEPEMDGYVGKVLLIADVTEFGVELFYKGESFNFPHFVLERANVVAVDAQCPFCGSAEFSCEASGQFDIVNFVQCCVCKAHGPIADSRDEALAKWKERHEK